MIRNIMKGDCFEDNVNAFICKKKHVYVHKLYFESCVIQAKQHIGEIGKTCQSALLFRPSALIHLILHTCPLSDID